MFVSNKSAYLGPLYSNIIRTLYILYLKQVAFTYVLVSPKAEDWERVCPTSQELMRLSLSLLDQIM